jgi:hypothetical protein
MCDVMQPLSVLLHAARLVLCSKLVHGAAVRCKKASKRELHLHSLCAVLLVCMQSTIKQAPAAMLLPRILVLQGYTFSHAAGQHHACT